MKKYLLLKIILISFTLFTLTSYGHKNVSDEDSFKNGIESSTKISGISSEPKELLEKVSSSTSKKEVVSTQNMKEKQPSQKDNKASFDHKHYITNKDYGVAPRVLKNEDMPRPEGNKEWIKSLTICYPQLYNMEDIDKEERINDVLFKEVLNIRDVMNNRNYVEYDIDYRIIEANEKILSVLFTGFIKSPQKANNLAYSVTIDLNKERIMDLSEFFKIDKSFVESHLHKDFKVVENNFENLKENDPYVEEYVKNYNQNTHKHDFYINNGTLGLIIPAPQAMGYILIEGKYQN